MFEGRGGYDFFAGLPSTSSQEYLRAQVDELNECIDLLGQVGMRRPPKAKHAKGGQA